MNLTKDLLNELLDINQSSKIYQLRQKRPTTVDATQKFFHFIFTLDIPSLSVKERTYVAVYTLYLTKQTQLKNYFSSAITPLSLSTLTQIEQNKIASIIDPKLKTLLIFTQQLVLDPDHSKPDNLEALKQIGLTTQAIVVLAQLIGFLSYQSRLLSGLTAINQYINNEGKDEQ